MGPRPPARERIIRAVARRGKEKESPAIAIYGRGFVFMKLRENSMPGCRRINEGAWKAAVECRWV